MPPKYYTRSLRGRCRGTSQKRREMERDVSSTETTISDNVSTEENESLKQSPKQNHTVNGEIEIPLFKLESNSIKSNIARSLMNQECNLTNAKLDHVQWELESMLSSATVRKNMIIDQLSSLKSMQLDCSQQSTENNPKCLYKPIVAAVADILPTNDNCEMNIESSFVNNDDPPPKRTKSANKFWSLVEPYLAHVKKEDIDWLENLVNSYDSSNNLYEIPPLGKHYANHWAQEELEIEKEQLCTQSTARNKLFEQITSDMAELINKVRYAGHNSSEFAPIYRRIITAILENPCYKKDLEENDVENKPQEMNKVCKEFYKEQNIKKQLYKLGMLGHHTTSVLSPTKTNSDEDCDEILEELTKCKSVLTELQKKNKIQLTELLGKCRKDYHQQIIINEQKKLDEQILNFGKRQNNLLLKGKKYAHYLKENNDLRLLLDKRSDYLKQLQPKEFEFSDSVTSLNLNNSKSDNSDSFEEEYVKKRYKYNTSIEQEVQTDECINLDYISISDDNSIEENTITISDDECIEQNVIIISDDD